MDLAVQLEHTVPKDYQSGEVIKAGPFRTFSKASIEAANTPNDITTKKGCSTMRIIDKENSESMSYNYLKIPQKELRKFKATFVCSVDLT